MNANGDTVSRAEAIQVLTLQYAKSFLMMRETIQRYDDRLWMDAESYESPAWQVIYHALHYANAYCSPTEEAIRKWPKSIDGLHLFAGTSSALPKDVILKSAYAKTDMLEYVDFVERNVPIYLKEMNPRDRCWPSWYEESQLEFHLNNLRHIQHHIGQVNERQNNVEPFDYRWHGE